MRKWLLKTRLFSWAYKQGGIDSFALVHKDILETMMDDLESRAEELSQIKLAELLSTFDPSQVLAIDPRTKTLILGGKQPNDVTLSNLRSEAEFLLESDLWNILYETPKALAEKAMFVDDGKLDTQLLKGRTILFTLATQKKIVDTIKSYAQPST